MEFERVTLQAKANVYFDARVSSRTFYMPDGTRKTLGLVTAGVYTFSTEFQEDMQILGGEFRLKLPGATDYVSYVEGDTFYIPSGIEFEVCTETYADYCCTYIEPKST